MTMKKLLIIVAIAIIALVAIANLFLREVDFVKNEIIEKTVTIENIISSPQDYADKQIVIKGVVSDPVGLFNHCWFKVSDGTGTITAHGKHYMAPADGEKVKLKGMVKLRFRVVDRNLLIF